MLVDKTQITSFIPQRSPIIMVDALEHFTLEKSTSTFFIEEDNLFVKEGLFQVAGLVENIAQSSALHSGYEYFEKAKEADEKMTPPIGYIGEVKNLTIFSLPKMQTAIHTTIEVLHVIFHTKIIKGTVYQENQVLATCETKVFMAE